MTESNPLQQDLEPGSSDAREGVKALRRHQRRSLWGGGGLLTALILFMALLGVGSAMREFAANQWDQFRLGQSALSAEFRQGGYNDASIANITDALWVDERDRLERDGETLLPSFQAKGFELAVKAEGRKSLPWLVLARPDSTLPQPDLARYLGLTRQHSLFASWIYLFIEDPNAFTFSYDPTHSFFLLSGVDNESTLLKALHVSTRNEALDQLQAMDERQRESPTAIVTRNGRIVYDLARNPVSGEMALFISVSLRDGANEYLRRVYFQPLAQYRAVLDRIAPGAFAIVSRRGDVLYPSNGTVSVLRRDAIAAFIEAHQAQLTANARMSWHENGVSTVIGVLPGTDWMLVHTYTFKDFWASQAIRVSNILGAALLSIAGLWLLLFWIHRRTVAPALAEAAMVYESEALNSTIITASPVGMCLVDAGTSTLILKNQRMNDVLGDRDFSSGHPVFTQLVEQLRTAATPAGELDWPLSVRWPNGSLRQLKVVATPARYRERDVWLCTFHDVTAQMEFEHHLESARQSAEDARVAAESASHAKSTFVANMSHEIRTPLHGILGHLELLADSPLDATQQARLHRVRQSADSLMGIISDVLDFSKIEAGQMDVAPAPFELRPVVEAAALLFAPQAQRKGVPLYFHIAPTLDGHYISDVHRIGQILNNLLSNAVKFTDSGRILLNVVRDDAAPDDRTWVRFEVLDSGIGLTPEQQRRIFKPFSQADQSIAQRYGGTGLGLVLCQQLAHLLGGHMDLRSTHGVGSIFRLHVPLTAAPGDALERETRPLHGMALVLLTSVQEWRTELGGYLSFQGARVITVGSGQELPTDVPENIVLVLVDNESAPPELSAPENTVHVERIVHVTTDGPLSPQWRDGAVWVSCYAGDALLDAVRGTVAATASHASAAAPSESARVLLVEDHPVNRELLREQLESLGYRVDATESGRAALQYWQTGIYRAVLTDLNMPEMSGYDLVKILRERDQEQPIFAVTASALASEKARCKELGVTELLLKPLSLVQLKDALLRWVVPPQAPVVPASSNQGNASSALPEKIRQVFLQRALEDIAAMDAALATDNTTQLVAAVHSFKGALMMLRESELAQRCSAMEEELREYGMDGLDEELTTLRNDLHQLTQRYRRPNGSPSE